MHALSRSWVTFPSLCLLSWLERWDGDAIWASWCPELGKPPKMHTAYCGCLLPQIRVPLVEKGRCTLRRKNQEGFTSRTSKASSLLGETCVITGGPTPRRPRTRGSTRRSLFVCPGAAVTKHCRLGGLTSRNESSHSAGAA